MKADAEEILKGLNQLSAGVMWPRGADPLPTFTNIHTDRTRSMVSSMPSRAFWKLADTSMPT